MSVESIQEALRILGLQGNPGREEIMKAFEEKLFSVHPDTSRYRKADHTYKITVDSVLEARKFLFERTALEIENDEDGYSTYKKADRLYGDALDAYFAVRKNYSFLNKDHPAELRFRKQLLEARGLFATVLERHPAGKWMVDSVERIARINNWLGTEGD